MPAPPAHRKGHKSPRADQALIAITVDLEMYRYYPGGENSIEITAKAISTTKRKCMQSKGLPGIPAGICVEWLHGNDSAS